MDMFDQYDQGDDDTVTPELRKWVDEFNDAWDNLITPGEIRIKIPKMSMHQYLFSAKTRIDN